MDFPTKGSRLKGSRLSTQHQLARKSAVWDNNDLMEVLSEKFEAMSASMEMMKREKELLERENRRLRASRDAPPGDNDVNTGSTRFLFGQEHRSQGCAEQHWCWNGQ